MLTMLTFMALVLADEPKGGFSVTRESVKIDKVIWINDKGQRMQTNLPFLQIKMVLKNESNQPLRWPGLSKGRLSYGTRYVGGAFMMEHPFEKGGRWEGSVEAGYEMQPHEITTLLLVFRVPKQREHASLELQWKGETPGYVVTVRQGFKLPEDP